MLPSKGYFSALPCPHYDSGECLRPHCHYRHSKKDKPSDCAPSHTSSLTINHQKNEPTVSKIQEFVSASVNVLSKSDLIKSSDNSCAVVSSNNEVESNHEVSKNDFPSYKPTPIAELNKRHIPVVYAPTKPYSLVRKKEVKESLLYLPRSISKSTYSTSNTYVPSSSGSSSSNSYTYQPSKITTSPYSVNDCKSLLKDNAFGNEEEKLMVLDRLVEEEFGGNYKSISLNNNKINQIDIINSDKQSNSEITENVKSNKKSALSVVNASDTWSENALIRLPSNPHIDSLKTDVISEKSYTPVEKKDVSCNTNTEKNGLSFTDSSQHKSTHKHESSSKISKENKLNSDDKSKKTHKKTETDKCKLILKSKEKKCNDKAEVQAHGKIKHSSNNDKEHSKSKSTSSNASSGHLKTKSSSNHKSSTDSKTKNLSNDTEEHKSNDLKYKEEHIKSKHSSSNKHEEHSKSKHTSIKIENHSKSKLSSSKKNEHLKPKINSLKDKKHANEHSKEKSRKRIFSECESKNDEQRSMSHKKCRKKEREGESRRKSNSNRDSCSPEKIMNIELSSDESDGNQSEQEKCCTSSSSDVEEIVDNGVTIVIDSSSNSPVSNCITEDMNSSRAGSASNSPPSSPPPYKKIRMGDEEKAAPTVLNLQSILCERWRKARETVLMRSSAPGKMKISQVPNVKNLLNAKDELFAKAKKKSLHPSTSGSKKKVVPIDEEYVPQPPARIAHTPKESIAQYPVIKLDDNLRVPVSIRQSCLNNIYDEYKKFLPLAKASEQAVQKEFEICQRTKVTMTYQNSCALAVLRIRKTKGIEEGDEKIQSTKKPALKSDSIPDYTHGWTLYKCFQDYILTDEELATNGYPLPLESFKGCAYVEKSARRHSNKQPEDKTQRVCAHCSKLYFVDENGFPLTENDCFYHWGKLRRTKIRGGMAEIYICCGADAGSEPCSSGRYHVSSQYDEDCLEGFVTTLPLRSSQSIDSAGIYGIDCEMIYTTQGLEVARCTVVDLEGRLVYDKFVLPDYPVLDYCTRFSGVTEVDLRRATLKLRDIQRDLLKLISEKTILVGHSLENDLKVLRLFHKTVVDTSIVFPHAKGPPFKKSLKHVAKEVLNINIQEQETGHDSKEDAHAALQCMLWKIRQDAKKRKPRVIISLDH